MLLEEAGSRTHVPPPSALEMRRGVMAAALCSPWLQRSLRPEPAGEAGSGVPPRMQLLETVLLPCLTSGVSPPPYAVTIPNTCTEAGKGDFVSVCACYSLSLWAR